ncbi:MAG: ABC transporter permease [Candidatus Bathyarchaeota archaeon]|nr:ABC transporter permease [Candidatus Bathyarchaeota archaeon]
MGILTRTIKSLNRRKTRTAIVIAALTLALTLLIVVPPSINERTAYTQTTIEVMGGYNDSVADLVTLSATEIQCEYAFYPFGPDPGLQRNPINQSLYSAIVTIPDVNTVIPVLDYWLSNVSLSIHGVPLNDSSYSKDPAILPSNITAGRNLQVGDSGVIVVDEIVAKNYIWGPGTPEEQIAALYAKDYVLHVGDSFEISGHKFTIVGIEGYDPVVSPHGVTMSLEDAWAVTGKAGMASKYFIFVDNVDSVGSVIQRIQNLDQKLMLTAGYLQLNTVNGLLSQIDDVTKSAQSTLTRIQSIGTAEIALVVVGVIVVILFMMLHGVRERTKEIGTLKAMGAGNSTILGQFILEGMLLCLISVVIALAISVFVMVPVSNAILPVVDHRIPCLSIYPNGTRWLDVEFTSGSSTIDVAPASVTPELMLFAIGLALLLGAVGSLYPALKAARTKPAEAMRYE